MLPQGQPLSPGAENFLTPFLILPVKKGQFLSAFGPVITDIFLFLSNMICEEKSLLWHLSLKAVGAQAGELLELHACSDWDWDQPWQVSMEQAKAENKALSFQEEFAVSQRSRCF